MNSVQCHVQIVSHNDLYERQVLTSPPPPHQQNESPTMAPHMCSNGGRWSSDANHISLFLFYSNQN